MEKKVFEFISLAQAKEMSESKLQLEIGRRTKYLKEKFGMDPFDAAYFTSSLLNMGAVMNEKFEEKKAKK